MPEAGPPAYQVRYPESVRIALRELSGAATKKGIGDSFLAALKRADQRLAHDPREYGEPTHRYRALKLLQHTVVDAPLVIQYAVHEDLPLVFVTSVRFL